MYMCMYARNAPIHINLDEKETQVGPLLNGSH
jgi:hypothetical protein